jgi:DNA polymerase-3 subunit alpha
MNLHSVNKKNIEALAISGAFDSMPDIKRHQFFCENQNNGSSFIETLLRYGNKMQEEKGTAQQSLFGEAIDVGISKPAIPECEEWSNLYQLNKEKELIGIYLSAHPLDDFKILIDNFCTEKVAQLNEPEKLNGKDIAFAGIVTAVRSATTKNGKPFGSITIEDFTDSYTLTLFGKDYLDLNQYFVKGYSLFIKAKFQKRTWGDSDQLELKIHSITTLPELWENIKKVTLKLKLDDITDAIINEITKVAEKNKGKSLLNFVIHDPTEKVWINMFSRSSYINVNDKVIELLKEKEEIEFKLE